MEPRQLLQWLVDRDGLNSSSLARKIKDAGISDKPTSQPQIHKFLGGVALEPKRATLQPVADYFKIPIDAFYDGEIAENVLADLKLKKSVSAAIDKPNHPLAQIQQAQTAIDDVAIAMRVIAECIGGLTQTQRRLIGPLLAQLAEDPDSHQDIANTLLMYARTPNAKAA